MEQTVDQNQVDITVPLEDRIVQLLMHLGVEQAHFAARMPSDWEGLAAKYPEAIASLTVFCQASLNATLLKHIASRLMVVFGDQNSDELQQSMADLPQATSTILHDYEGKLWDDIILDRGQEIGTAILDFTAKIDQERGMNSIAPSENGEIAGLTYQAYGFGRPLILLPLGLAPSQWEPLLPKLNEHFCTIVLGGPDLGVIPSLEACGFSAGYQRLLRSMLEEIQLRPGEKILDVGCGTGVIDRWLAHQTDGVNPIVAVDVNNYLLNEAAALATMERLDSTIDFREGDAEDLPFDDNEFEITLSSTVLEEVDADKMLAEMIRVTKPGGRVGAIVRATDLPWLFNVPLPAALKEKIENAANSVEEGKGCASVSLYQHFQGSILTNIKMMPQLVVFDDPQGGVEKIVEASILSRLSPEEADLWQVGKAAAVHEGTFFFTWPHHCAVGTKAL